MGLLLRNCRVLNTVAGTCSDDRFDVLVSGERIAAITRHEEQPQGGAEAPPAAAALHREIDCRGLVLMPGLCDAVSHPLPAWTACLWLEWWARPCVWLAWARVSACCTAPPHRSAARARHCLHRQPAGPSVAAGEPGDGSGGARAGRHAHVRGGWCGGCSSSRPHLACWRALSLTCGDSRLRTCPIKKEPQFTPLCPPGPPTPPGAGLPRYATLAAPTGAWRRRWRRERCWARACSSRAMRLARQAATATCAARGRTGVPAAPRCAASGASATACQRRAPAEALCRRAPAAVGAEPAQPAQGCAPAEHTRCT